MSKVPASKAIDINLNDNIRIKPTSPCKTSSRSSSVSSMVLSIPYHKWMEVNNNIPDKDIVKPIDSLQLLYEEFIGQDKLSARQLAITTTPWLVNEVTMRL